jgi:hypothetical protein
MPRTLEDIEPGDDREGCGFSWDHTPVLVGEADGIRTYECRECGATLDDEEDDEVTDLDA